MRRTAGLWETSPLARLNEAAPLVVAMCDEMATLRARVTKLEAAAECAFQVLEEIVDDTEEPDGDAVTAYQMLFDVLDKAPAQLTDPDYADLPY